MIANMRNNTEHTGAVNKMNQNAISHKAGRIDTVVRGEYIE